MKHADEPTTLRSAIFHALRACFRALPLGESTRDAWRSRFLDRFPAIRPQPARGQAGATFERRPRVHSGGRALGYVERRDEALPEPLPATLVAFYLPQFHTIPENDAWWGKGFTEWRNVARALPQFEGHAQPRLPGDLGFYDLRNPQVMRDQAELARAYGIGAFCFYFYWFGGKTLLEAPLRQWLEDDSIDFPFCLCWANENWSRRWDGRAGDVLIAQAHDAEDDLAFIARAAGYLRDPRHLRVDGKPILLVYRPGLLPAPAATAQRWRDWCRENGIGEIFLAYVQGFERPHPRDIGFDAAVEFPPNLGTPGSCAGRQSLLNPQFHGEILDWREIARDYARRPLPDYRLFPGVNCGWDNTPRRPQGARIHLHASPARYREWLHATIHDRLGGESPRQRMVFINAWNEWAEGAVLEPDAGLGYAWLDATRAALRPSPAPSSAAAEACAVVHAWYPGIVEEILHALDASGVRFRLVVTTTPDKADAIREVVARRRPDAEVEVGPNRGRDVLPFLRTLHRLRGEGEQLVLKLHTKRSPHLPDGAAWRRDLLEGLVSPGRARALLAAFSVDPTIGIVAADGHLASTAERLGGNRENLRYLAARVGLHRVDEGEWAFPSGSMFWARMDAIAPLLDAHLHEWEFDAEDGQVDGTLAHAVERIIGVCAEAQGLRTVEAGALLGKPRRTF